MICRKGINPNLHGFFVDFLMLMLLISVKQVFFIRSYSLIVEGDSTFSLTAQYLVIATSIVMLSIFSSFFLKANSAAKYSASFFVSAVKLS